MAQATGPQMKTTEMKNLKRTMILMMNGMYRILTIEDPHPVGARTTRVMSTIEGLAECLVRSTEAEFQESQLPTCLTGVTV